MTLYNFQVYTIIIQYLCTLLHAPHPKSSYLPPFSSPPPPSFPSGNYHSFVFIYEFVLKSNKLLNQQKLWWPFEASNAAVSC